MVQGRNKGHEFERVTGKVLKKHWGHEFVRTPLSGGWHFAGDLVPIVNQQPQIFPIVFECKKQEGWDFAQLFSRDGTLNKKCPILQWWDQAVTESKGRMPWLIFSKNFATTFLMMRESDFILFHSAEKFFHIAFNLDGNVVIIVPFEKFIKQFTYFTVLDQFKYLLPVKNILANGRD